MRILTIVAAFAACFTLLPAAVLLTGRGASAESATGQPDSSEVSGTEPIQFLWRITGCWILPPAPWKPCPSGTM